MLEPEESEIAAGIEDGEMIDPHAMDPQTVLRFVRAVSGWPGSVVVIACEPAEVEEPGMGLYARGRGRRAARRRARRSRRSADLREKAERASAL